MKLDLDINEVLRYMGEGEFNIESLALAKTGIETLEKTYTPRFAYTKLPKTILPLKGNDIAIHLKDCDHVYILVATLGAKVDKEIKLTQYKSMASALALDAAACEGIEKLCDLAELEIINKEFSSGNFVTGRYSPGYGDFPLDIQPTLIQFTDASKKIGLTVNSSNLLIPKKSVTALLGVSNIPTKGKTRGCSTCNLADRCNIRKLGGCNNA